MKRENTVVNKLLKSVLDLGFGLISSTSVLASPLAEPGEWYIHHEMWISGSEQGEYKLKESGEMARCRSESDMAKADASLRGTGAAEDGVFGKCKVTRLDQGLDHISREVVCKQADGPDRVFTIEATRHSLHLEIQGGPKVMGQFFLKLVESDQFIGPCTGQVPPLK